MVDDLRYPALIVMPPNEDYVKRPSGGGGQPQTFADVEETRVKILDACKTMKDHLHEAEQTGQPVGIARLKLRDNAVAKSHRPREAFTQDTCPVIGDLNEIGELAVLVTESKLDRLSRKIRSLDSNGSAHLTSIESFALIGLERRFPTDTQSAISHHLKYHKQAWLRIRLPRLHLFGQIFQEELEQKLLMLVGNEEKPYLDQGDFVVYAVNIHSMDQAMEIASLQFIDRLDLMPIYVPSSNAVIDVASLRLATNNRSSDLPIVAIVDTGIDPRSPLAPLIYARKKYVDDYYYNPSHGTAVAALAAAQEGIVSNELIPRCQLLDVTIVPNTDEDAGPTDTLYEHTLVYRLEEALESYGSVVKQWNLSLATPTGSRPTGFSYLAMELDRLHKQYDVTFYCSPGNCELRSLWPPTISDTSSDWIAPPGDALCGVTVGSCTPDDSPEGALAPGSAPSPFSPHGPIAYSVIKPDLVEVGGNIGGDGITRIGVNTIQPNGEVLVDVGTSFSTPRVCGVSAELAACIARNGANASNTQLLTKTLLLHHASIPPVLALGLYLPDFYGYGKPASLENMAGDPFWRSTSLICGRLYPNGEDLVIDDFPYPDGLSTDKGFEGKIWITMASEPIIDPSFKVEYARSNVDVHFGVMKQNRHKEQFFGQVKCVHSGPGTSLARELHKWSPVKQYRNQTRMFCSGDRWRLRVEMALRDKESDAIKQKRQQWTDFPVDIVLAVTIVDPNQFVQVNNQMFQKWRARGYIPTQIGIVPRLRTRFSY